MNNSEIITVNNIYAYYKTSTEKYSHGYIHALDGISFSIHNSEILGIAGESGCGKSTLIKVLYGLLDPPLTLINGDVIYKFGKEEISIKDKKFKRKCHWKLCSYIPQSSMGILNPTMRIKDHFFEVLKAHHKYIDKKEQYENIIKHIQHLGLPIEVLTSFPHQLSGGMKQRIVIALATFLKPKVIFADEPTTALDVITQKEVLQLLLKIQKESKNTIVLVTHDIGIHAQVTQKLIVMYAGKIVEYAPTREIFKNFHHPYVKMLIESLPIIGDKSIKQSMKSAPISLINPPSGCRFHPRCPLADDKCKKEEPNLIEILEDHYVSCFKWELI
ncbi:MAG: ABC transporter ATP-binding protein [Candidatus Methanomethylicia archaeon]